MFLFADSSFVGCVARKLISSSFVAMRARERALYLRVNSHNNMCLCLRAHARNSRTKRSPLNSIKPPTLHQYIQMPKTTHNHMIGRIWSKSLSRTIREPEKESLFVTPTKLGNCLAQVNLQIWIKVSRSSLKIKKNRKYSYQPKFQTFFFIWGDVALFLFGFRVLVAIFGHASFEFRTGRASSWENMIFFVLLLLLLISEVCKHVCEWWSMVLPWIA